MFDFGLAGAGRRVLVPSVVMVFTDVDPQVAALLGSVGAVRTLVRGSFTAALYVLVSTQGGLPAVLFPAVTTLELARRRAGRPGAPAPLLDVVRQHYVVGVVVLVVVLDVSHHVVQSGQVEVHVVVVGGQQRAPRQQRQQRRL